MKKFLVVMTFRKHDHSHTNTQIIGIMAYDTDQAYGKAERVLRGANPSLKDSLVLSKTSIEIEKLNFV